MAQHRKIQVEQPASCWGFFMWLFYQLLVLIIIKRSLFRYEQWRVVSRRNRIEVCVRVCVFFQEAIPSDTFEVNTCR